MEAAVATPAYPESSFDRGVVAERMPRILVMSTSLLTDRVFLFTEFLNELNTASTALVWASSFGNPRFRSEWNNCPAAVDAFPEVRPYKQFPYNFLRRLNEFVWDFRQSTPSRLSMWKHVRSKSIKPRIRVLRLPARAIAVSRLERVLEDRIEELLLSYPRSREAVERLRAVPLEISRCRYDAAATFCRTARDMRPQCARLQHGH